MKQDPYRSEKARYFGLWMRYAATLVLSKSEQDVYIKFHTGKSTIKECEAADLRMLLLGLGVNPDEEATA